MLETIDRLMLAGLGAMSMTRERVEKIFDDYVSRGKVEKESRTGFVKEVVDIAEKNRKDFEKLISEQVHKTIDKLELATQNDIKRLEEKLDRLLDRE